MSLFDSRSRLECLWCNNDNDEGGMLRFWHYLWAKYPFFFWKSRQSWCESRLSTSDKVKNQRKTWPKSLLSSSPDIIICGYGMWETVRFRCSVWLSRSSPWSLRHEIWLDEFACVKCRKISSVLDKLPTIKPLGLTNLSRKTVGNQIYYQQVIMSKAPMATFDNILNLFKVHLRSFANDELTFATKQTLQPPKTETNNGVRKYFNPKNLGQFWPLQKLSTVLEREHHNQEARKSRTGWCCL